MNKHPLLQLSNIKKSYSSRQILDDVSISIMPGEIVGLLGHNGGGKTTAFYITIGLVQQDAGSISFHGKDISLVPVHQRAKMGMGYLAQEPSIFRSLSVEDNILCVLETLSLSPLERLSRLEKALREMNLTHLAKKKTTVLSGGEKRRVEIARVLVTHPSLLLLDEPFANIDPISISDVKKMILLLKDKGISIFITDHNAREIFSLVDRSYLIVEGKILAEGTSSALLQNDIARNSYLGSDFRL